MPAGRRSVAIRIGVEGDADVRNAFTRIGDAGDAQARRIGKSFERDMQSVEAAVERANRTAARLSAVSNSPQASIDRVTGSGSAGAANGAAMRSAQALGQELDRAEQEARQLLAAIDPLFAAQSRYGDQVARIEALRATGAISEANYIRLLAAEQTELTQVTLAQQRHTQVSGMMRAGQQQLAFQLQDVFTQMSSGTRVSVIAAQQLPQMAFALTMIGEASQASGVKLTGFKGAMVGAASFMTTGWGAAITGGILLLTTLIPLLTGSADGHRDAGRAADDHRTAEQKLRDTILEQRQALEQQLQLNGAMVESHRQIARQARETATAIRQETSAMLEQALANEQQAVQLGEAGATEGGGGAQIAANMRISRLQSQLASNDAELSASRRQEADANIEQARELATLRGQFGREMDIREHNLQVFYRRGMAGATTDADRAALTGRMRQAEDALHAARDRGLQAISAQESAERRMADTRDTGRRVTAAQGTAIIQSIGGHVNSAQRSLAEQRVLWERSQHGGNPAARPTPNAPHVRGDAWDVAAGPGINNATIREAFRRQGVNVTSYWENDHYHVQQGGGGGRGNGERHAETMARQSDSREVDIRGTLALAQAYLQSSTAAARAEASRQGLTEATRQGGDTSARVRQQLDIETAQVIANGARGVAQMREETAARAEVNARVADGTLSVRDMQQQLDDEARLRPLLARQTLAQGDALRILNLTINATREALRKLHEEEAHGRALVDIQQLSHANDNARAALGIQAPNDRERAVREAMLRGSQEAGDRGYNWQDSAAYSAQRGNEEVLRQQRQAADQFRQMNAEGDDRVALLRTELSLGGLGEQQRARALAIEEQRLRLEREFGPEHRAEIEQILDKARAEQELQLQVERVRDAQREVEQVGGNVIDEIFNIDNWDNWGEAGKRVLHMILQEMITLAAVNPLKNMLFGQNNPTLGSVGGALGGLFGGGGKGKGIVQGDGMWGGIGSILGGIFGGGAGGGMSNTLGALLKMAPGAFATGTEYAPGGMAWLGENGPELVKLPRGSRVTPAGESRRMAANNNAPIVVINTFDLNGAVVTEDLLRQMDSKAKRAAQEGARLGFDTVMQAHRDSHGMLFATR